MSLARAFAPGHDCEERAAAIALASFACTTCGAYDTEPESCPACALPTMVGRDEPIYARAARELAEHGEVQPETMLLCAIFEDYGITRDGWGYIDNGGDGVVVHLGKATPNGWRS